MHMKTSLLLIACLWSMGLAQSTLLWEESMQLSASAVPFHLDGTEARQMLDLDRSLLIDWRKGQTADTFELGERGEDLNLRGAVCQPDTCYLLDYWNEQFIAVPRDHGPQQRYQIENEWDGVAYDLFSWSLQSISYLPTLDAIACYVVPIGDEDYNLFLSSELYQCSPLVGLFRLEGQKATLFRLIGQRDSIYWKLGGILPHMQYVSVQAHPDGQSIFLGQGAVPTIQQLDLQGQFMATFGQAGRHATRDTLIPILPASITSRQVAVYQRMATAYGSLYVDPTNQRLYRSYRLGEPIDYDPDSVNRKLPPPPEGSCRVDRYVDDLLAEAPPLRHGLQVYDLSQTNMPLLHDVLLPAPMTLLYAKKDHLWLLERKKDGYWLSQARLVAQKNSTPFRK